ncbi:hypothetical protein ACFFX0_14645 [Citricoccus parietis]|uniref:Uncharacterized protein n=1 Tax=Citricoccus parietis TaxID=592307 RepID=A0ABV5G095_9MICC
MSSTGRAATAAPASPPLPPPGHRSGPRVGTRPARGGSSPLTCVSFRICRSMDSLYSKLL